MKFCPECGEPMQDRGPVLHVESGYYCTNSQCVNNLKVQQERVWYCE